MNDTVSEKTRGWTRRKDARPGEILDAALEVFAEKGFAATRMEDIATRAGVTKGTIYLYYPGKEELFKSLARETIGKALAIATLNMASFAETPRQSLIRALTTITEFLNDRRREALPKIIIAESGNFPELATFWRQEVVDKAFTLLCGIYDRGVEMGQFRPLPREDVVRLCVSPILLSIIWRTTFNDTFDNTRFLETHLDTLYHGLLTPEACHAPQQ